MLSPSQVDQIRSRFPIFNKKTYLNSCSQGALSDVVRKGFDDYLYSWDENGSPWDVWVDEYEAARRTFAGFIGADADEVAIVPSASAGINAIASALSFRERDKIALGVFDFPTMGHVWLAQRPRGARIEFVEAVEDTLPASNYSPIIDRNTVIVPVAGMCFMNGWRAQLEPIVRYAHDAGALVMLDDYQDCGTRPVDVKAMNVDIYVSGTLKYLLGPPGVAMMYVRTEVAQELNPTISGWFAQRNPFTFNVRDLDMSPTARRFEAGTPPIPNLYAAKEGIALLQSVGMQEVADHISSLASVLIHGAQQLGITLKTPPDSVGPLVVMKCSDAESLVAKLAARDIVVSSRRDGLRVGLHVYNTAADIEVLLSALQEHIELLVPSAATTVNR